MKIIKIFSLSFLVVAVSACLPTLETNIPEDDGGTSEATHKGQLLDSYVENIAYETETQSGRTTSNGTYKYNESEKVTFSIGGISFPVTDARGLTTPFTIVNTTSLNDKKVINIARLLQTLDLDNNPENGIMIPEVAHSVA